MNEKKKDYERIDESSEHDGVRESHELRYRIANSFIQEDDNVFDACCGIGYGEKLMKGKYLGVDKNPTGKNTRHDFNDLPYMNSFIDVFVGFEAIEHLEDGGVKNFVATAKQANKWIIVSAPIVPTVGWNPYHLQDFTKQDIIDLFQDKNWELNSYLNQQPKYGVFVFKRNNN